MKLKIWTLALIISLLMINGLYVVNGSTEEDSSRYLKILEPVEKVEQQMGSDYSSIHHTFNLTYKDDIPPESLDLLLDYSADEILSLKVRCNRPDDLGSDGSILVYKSSSVDKKDHYSILRGMSSQETIYNTLYEYEDSSENISKYDVDPIASVFGKNDGDILGDPEPLKGEYSFEMILTGKNLNVQKSEILYKGSGFSSEGKPPEKGLTTETVVNGTFDSAYSSYISFDMKVDAGGDPHVFYKPSYSDHLKYRYWDGNDWKTENVTECSDLGSISIEVKNDGDLHILYGEQQGENTYKDTYSVEYGHKENGSWSFETITEEGNRMAKLKITPEGEPCVLYTEPEQRIFKYAVKVDGQWTDETVTDGVSSSRFNSDIAFDEEGDPHIVYGNEFFGYLKYAHRQDGEWKSESLDYLSRDPVNPLIEIGDGGNIYVLYQSTKSPTHGLVLAQRKDSDWSFELVNVRGSPSCLEVSDEDNLHLVYTKRDFTADTPGGYGHIEGRHCMKTDGEWKTENLGKNLVFKDSWEYELDKERNPHFFHLNQTDDKMKLEYTRIEGTKGAYRESEKSDETGESDESGDLFNNQDWILIPVVAIIAILAALFGLIKKRSQEEKQIREEEPFQDEEDEKDRYA